MAGSGAGSSGAAVHIHASTVPDTMWSPTRTRSRTCTPVLAASGNSSSGCADCTYPDIGASSGTAHSGGVDVGVLDSAQPPVHHGQSVQFNPFADRVDLDGVCKVVREIHHHGQAGEQQHQSPR